MQVQGNGTKAHETLRQKRERIERERKEARERVAAARPAREPAAPSEGTVWTFEDEEAVGPDAVSPIACEFIVSLLEGVAPGAINSANRALLDVLRTKFRRAVLRGHAAAFVQPRAEEQPVQLMADAPKAQDAAG